MDVTLARDRGLGRLVARHSPGWCFRPPAGLLPVGLPDRPLRVRLVANA